MLSRKLFLSCLVIVLYGCGAQPVPGTPEATPQIAEYVLATATATLSSEPTLEFVPPTPTPQLYTIVQNDTLFAIAARFNITLDALMAANPGLNAQALAPGTELLIPTGLGTSTTPMPQITPVPATHQEPACYASAAGELWCLVLVTNDTQQTLENVTGFVRLLDSAGESLGDAEAVPPLNLLPTGAAMPLLAYFPSAPDGWVTARAEIATAFSVQEDAALYVSVQDVQFSWTLSEQNQKSAHVQGRAQLETNASAVWVMAVAYDDTGAPVGTRRWESTGDVGFDFWVYSLGPDIADVKIVVEAHP